MILFDRFIIPDVSIAVCIKYLAEDTRNTLFVLLCEQKISYTDVSEITSEVIWSLKWALWPHINILLLFLVVERGLNSYSMSLHQICKPIIAKQVSDMYQKIILNRDIAIWSFISVLIWKQNLHLILLLIANNVIYVNFFWAVFSHIHWFEICHIVGVWYVIYVSRDISDSQI